MDLLVKLLIMLFSRSWKKGWFSWIAALMMASVGLMLLLFTASLASFAFFDSGLAVVAVVGLSLSAIALFPIARKFYRSFHRIKFTNSDSALVQRRSGNGGMSKTRLNESEELSRNGTSVLS